ncbi:MAG TPA: tetratricopeptide repeat protein, partial [Chloroflexota bacterium]|nr:tetratricopeptide repeat protein [Chloroflexota bacterium]
AALKDLGPHRLRDMRDPERVFQLIAPGLPTAFGPLNAPGAVFSNLPAQLTSFVDREEEVTALRQLLTAEEPAPGARQRLLTLTGPGGCGKTRLALEVAALLVPHFPDGVWLVELAPLAEPDLVPQLVATTLGVEEEAGRSLTETLIDHLRSRQALVVLDNCEHLLPACATLLSQLLGACPQLRVLATGRERLRIVGERVWPVSTLSVPDEGATITPELLKRSPAVELFLDRAAAVAPEFALTAQNAPALATICRRLDGLPLALELAAPRVRVLTPAQFAARLDDRISLLGRGALTAPSRQQSLDALVDWSHDLLIERERMLFARLSVFAGRFTLEAIEAVCTGPELAAEEVLDLLDSLIEKSLVVPGPESADEPTYRLLDTLRRYAARRLAERGEAAAVHERQAIYYLELAEAAEEALVGPAQKTWLRRLEAEHDNLRATLGWATQGGLPELGLRLAGALARFWSTHGHPSEGLRWLETALDSARDAPPRVRAKALRGAGSLARYQGQLQRARACWSESLDLMRQEGDTGGVAQALDGLGSLAFDRGDHSTARALYEEAHQLWRQVGDRRGMAISLHHLALEARAGGDFGRAGELHTEALALFRELGDTWGIAYSLGQLGSVARTGDDFERAAALLTEALALFRELGDKQEMAMTLAWLGTVAQLQGDFARAVTLCQESLGLFLHLGDRPFVAVSLDHLAAVAQAMGHFEAAAWLFGAADAVRETTGAVRSPSFQPDYEHALAALRETLGEVDLARILASVTASSLEGAIAYALSFQYRPPPPPATPARPGGALPLRADRSW